MTDEFFDIIDEKTLLVIGRAPRSACHGNPALLHRAARILLFDTKGNLLLQKRAGTKKIQPGKWDASVGGHLDAGEDYAEAALREMGEELGVREPVELEFLFDLKVRNSVESENVRVYRGVRDGAVEILPSEVDEARLFSMDELKKLLAETPRLFTPLLRRELELLFGCAPEKEPETVR